MKIAPRLFDGNRRERLYQGLPPHIKHGLKLIAARENMSVSWMMEQIIIRYFNLREPRYIGKEKVVKSGGEHDC